MANCSGKHISALQLFYELKQRFPNIPDRFVTHCIIQTRGNQEACTCLLEAECLHSRYSMSSSRRPNTLHFDSKTKEDKGGYVAEGSSRSAPTTPCSITRRSAIRTFRRASAPRALYTLEQTPNRGAQLLIETQLERKNNLEKELEKDKKKLEAMQKRSEELKARLAARNSPLKATLAEEIAALQEDCAKLWSEIDSSPESGNIKTSIDLRGAAGYSGGERNEGPHWRCHICTFQNHPLLNQCESCTMPRITLEGSETPNIHIRVTHHKFPSCSKLYLD
ncbi:uncharacterized protein isoform X2 [Rhodnius prolixus]|uniref:uncharacterized protein isoform X2 n=1 Tax=Rhodnius prolixus TaxID=13249 RepID=UPI003D18EE3E